MESQDDTPLPVDAENANEPFAEQVEAPVAPAKKKVRRRRNPLGMLGFLVALVGLVVFGIPFVGESLCALGLLLSLLGLLKSPRGYAVSGILTTGVSVAFFAFFIGNVPFQSKSKTLITDIGTVISDTFVGDVIHPQNDAAEDEFDSLDDEEITDDTDDTYSRRGITVFGTRQTKEDLEDMPGIAEEPEVLEKKTSSETKTTEEAGTPPIPVAAFEEIAKYRRSWPKRVRISRNREIVLVEKKTKEIMGRMGVPKGTVVEVLEVFSDGALEVLDCTDQRFKILAADTDFAEQFLLRNPAWVWHTSDSEDNSTESSE